MKIVTQPRPSAAPSLDRMDFWRQICLAVVSLTRPNSVSSDSDPTTAPASTNSSICSPAASQSPASRQIARRRLTAASLYQTASSCSSLFSVDSSTRNPQSPLSAGGPFSSSPPWIAAASSAPWRSPAAASCNQRRMLAPFCTDDFSQKTHSGTFARQCSRHD